MFEKLVGNLLSGYLSQYFKDIQIEQLKITVWNEEVLLENVELILEAFDYLQLPFALKQGRVGRLSIKIPWKKLGWDPIVIILEDIFISASQREDQEWSMDAVGKREFAGKKAKLAAAELAKLKKRVCDSQAGQSFISYITAKILDSIQVSVRNFHVMYTDVQSDPGHIMFGLKFSSLMIMKQIPTGTSSGRGRGGQVNIVVEIKGLELYSIMFQGKMELIPVPSAVNIGAGRSTAFAEKTYDSLLAPCDVSLLLLANRSGKLGEYAPQYSVTAELTGLVLSLDEAQLHQLLFLWDYLCTSQLREKYGRYRPWCSSLSRKHVGWQILWWHYAQEAVLSEVRKKLRKTSWKYLGERLNFRRRYIKLYQTKLDFLRKEQQVPADTLEDLEQMEKESELDDILNYRSAAEYELQEILSRSSTLNMGTFDAADISVDKSRIDEHSTGKSRGWLNWLSRGMLGAGGTDDSGQFSGVVSDEVIKDIYEATEFRPPASSNSVIVANDEIYLCAMKFSIHQISATLRSKKHDQEIAELMFNGATIESKLWKDWTTVSATVKSGKMVDPCSKKITMLTRTPIVEKNNLDNEEHSCSVHVDVSPNHDVELSIKGILQGIELTVDTDYISNLMEFFDVFKSFKFQQERVLLSLNEFGDINTRLLSKAEYILSGHKKVMWDITIINVCINVPWRNTSSEKCKLVMESGSLTFMSKHYLESHSSHVEEQPYIVKNLLNSISSCGLYRDIKLEDLYHYVEINLNDFEIRVMDSDYSREFSILEKFCASITVAFCVIPDESILKQLEVFVIIQSIHAHFSPSIYSAVVEVVSHLGILQSKAESLMRDIPDPHDIMSNVPKASSFGFSISSNLESVSLQVDISNNEDNGNALMISLQELDIQYTLTDFEECWVCMKALKISTCALTGEQDGQVLYLSGNLSPIYPACQHDADVGPSNGSDHCTDTAMSTNASFALHYESWKTEIVCQKCTIYLNDADVHCYPHVVGLLNGFFTRLSACGTDTVKSSACVGAEISAPVPSFGFQRFGFSNYFESGSSGCASIPLDNFPFVTISNSSPLGNLESSLIYAVSEWRKYFSLRGRKIRSSKFSIKSGSKFFHGSLRKSKSTFEAYHESGSSGITSQFIVDLHLCGLRMHFHDSSCIVGTVTLPMSKCSMFFSAGSMDILSSIEGLVLTSSWWTQNFREYLWGQSSPNLSPIINVRVRKGRSMLCSDNLEVSISIQHVYCMLPPEYLAIIIGYFSLPDWNSVTNDQLVTKGNDYIAPENDSDITYKFEILDSSLILPPESNECQFLKVEIQQLYCSFIHSTSADKVTVDIPPELLVPVHKLAKRNNSLNVFGRELCLSFLLFKDDICDHPELSEDTDCVNVSLIAPLSVDVWVRIPCDSEYDSRSSSIFTCVMINIKSCEIVAGDNHFFDGCVAFWDVINQFSLVDGQSKGFKSDVLQFLHLKRCPEEIVIVSPSPLSIILTEVICNVDSLLINFMHRRCDAMELIAKADSQFVCSASLRNDSLECLNLGFSSFALYSSHNSLAKCSSICSSSSVLDISVSKSINGEHELCVSLPSLDVWLHLSEWNEVLNLFNHYTDLLAKSTQPSAPSKKLSSDDVDSLEVADSPSCLPSINLSSHSAKENMKGDVLFLIIRSEIVGITFHLPVWVSGEPSTEFQLEDDHSLKPWSASSDTVEETNSRVVTVTLQFKSFELFVGSGNIRLKLYMEKLGGMIKICENQSCLSWPFFEFFQVYVDSDISNDGMEVGQVKVEIQCDRSNVWLSHPAFYFWSGLQFNVPESGSSQFSSGGVDFKFQLRKVSFLLSEEKWSCSGPLLEVLMRNLLLHVNVAGENMECSVTSDLHVNYNNIHKVVWEPFIEPWQFEMTLIRKYEMNVLVDSAVTTDILLKSTEQLNLNITESFVECVSRTIEMIKDAWVVIHDLPEGQKFLVSPFAEYMSTRRYAPYVVQNLTSVPLQYHVYQGSINPDECYDTELKEGNYVQPGSSVPIFIHENTKEQQFRNRPSHSSDSLHEQKLNGFAHNYITIKLDGTSMPSAPMSMDLVGLTFFEVNFSKTYNEADKNGTNTATAFVVPVVFDVSVQRYSKLVRLYSTVVLSNATATPLELRFDIPFGVSPKILDPIYPGQELPLPLHLAEAGYLRWRPIGNSYLWSEAHNLSNLLSLENRIGFLKSFVCYPSHPSSDPFRCCISVRNISLTSSGRPKKDSPLHDINEARKRFVYCVTISAPFIVNNNLPKEISLTTESSGVNRTTIITEVETTFHHIDPSQDLGLEIHIDGFRPSDLKFPRSETFYSIAKLNGTKFSLLETVTLDPDIPNGGPTYVIVEKVMDAFSGTREIFIFVPFLLYNCSGFPLFIKEAGSDVKGGGVSIIPSCYELGEQESFLGKKDGLCLLSSSHDLHARDPHSMRSSLLKNHIISTRQNTSPHFSSKPLFTSNHLANYQEQSIKCVPDYQKSFLSSLNNRISCSSLSSSLDSNTGNYEHERVKPCMYAPNPISSVSEVLVKVSRCFPEWAMENLPNSLWSNPFFLVPPSGSSTILLPQSSSNAALILSVTSSEVAEPYAGRTSAICFQPRYVISNACSKDLCYKQKGTDILFHLGVREHAHLHWTDTTRDLLISICYDEPGWQWSGGFLPDHLGDTQVKLKSYVSGAVNMIRVEVQNADVSVEDEKIVGSLHGNSSTNLILLSDDNTGYMPYRIDNFSKERLRIYQHKCDAYETMVHSYTSCLYAWDEPCYPHRLIVEVPGERVVGSYALDDVREYLPVHLASTSEKPERTLFLSVHAEGATKVLNILDSNYHILSDAKQSNIPHFRGKKRHDHKQDKSFDYMEKLSVEIPCIGISLINSYPQELLFACAKDITIDLLQSLDQQRISFQISSLQIDNQLRITPYPVILSFDGEYKSNPAAYTTIKDDLARTRGDRISQMPCDASCDPVFYLAASKWRKDDISFISFEYISLRIADFRLELEQELILSLFDFFTNVSTRFEYEFLLFSGPLMHPHSHNREFLKVSTAHVQAYGGNQLLLKNASPLYNAKTKVNLSLPTVVPIGAPWQKIYLLARTQRKVYVEVFELAPIKLTLSFSSAPWMLRNRIFTSGEFLFHRGLMALADVEGARIHLRQLTIAHHMASWESIQEILIRHYIRQLIHEMYKVFGSAGVIGNPMGFARSVGLGIKDFLSVPARSIVQSPSGLISGMAEGTSSLLSNTVYAISDAASQFSKAARKGIVAFTYDDQAASRLENQQIGRSSHSKGVINEVLEGLTGLLQSPIKGAEKHGLPGVLSGIALGITGLVAKPAASILEVTGKTALSIRNRSKPYQMRSQRFRVRLPRPLSSELPLRPYSWEEAVGTSVLMEADDSLKLKEEALVFCKALKEAGKFVIITERLVLIVFCPGLVNWGKPEFPGIAADLEWIIESEIGLESVILVDNDKEVIHIVGSSPDTLSRQNPHSLRRGSGGGSRARTVRWNNFSTPLPLFQTNLELTTEEDAENLLKTLLSTIETGKERGWGCGHFLHRSHTK